MHLRFDIRNWNCLRSRTAAVMVSLTCTSATLLNGQQLRTLDRNAQCAQCTVELRSFARTTDNGDDIVLGALAFSRVLDERRIAIVGPGMQGLHVLSTSTGDVRSIGQRGSGPGEYRSITNLLRAPSGVTFVLDRSLRRATQLDASLRAVKTIPFQDVRAVTTSIVSDDGQFVTSGSRAGKESAGRIFHRYDALGRYKQSFGAVSSDIKDANETRYSRRVMIAFDNTFWATSATEFRLEHWTFDGHLIVTISSVQPNLRPRRTGEWPFGSSVPPEVILAISEFGADTAMIVTRVPKNPWPKVLPIVVSSAEGRSMSYPISRDSLDRYFRTRIDLIDLKGARLIASTIIPFATWGIGDRELSHSIFDKENLETLEFLRVHLNKK